MDASMRVAICNFSTCACVHVHVKHDKHGCLHEGGHLQFQYMCMCACACAHVCGHPLCPQMHPNHLSPPKEPQGGQNTKIQ